MWDFLLFFLVSLSAAFVGWAVVVIASRIEHEHQERAQRLAATKTANSLVGKSSSDLSLL
jgi:hypothetical protein